MIKGFQITTRNRRLNFTDLNFSVSNHRAYAAHEIKLERISIRNL